MIEGTRPAIDEAARFDRKIVIEEGVGGKKRKAREIECSVLGNDDPKASVAGEIVPCKEFYDYDAKYLDEGSELVIPAKITKSEMKKVQTLAVAALQAVDCSGLARVDFLMHPKPEDLCQRDQLPCRASQRSACIRSCGPHLACRIRNH